MFFDELRSILLKSVKISVIICSFKTINYAKFAFNTIMCTVK
jgi:hypothetical protein